MKPIYTILKILFIGIVLFGCDVSKDKKIKEELKAFYGEVITFGDIEIIPFNLPDSTSLSDYINARQSIIVYIDSMMLCPYCWAKYLNFWSDKIATIENSNTKVMAIFNTENITKVRKEISMYNIDIPFFFDISGAIKRSTKAFPKMESLKTFLVRDGNVVLIGSPVGNEHMMMLYEQEAKSLGQNL